MYIHVDVFLSHPPLPSKKRKKKPQKPPKATRQNKKKKPDAMYISLNIFLHMIKSISIDIVYTTGFTNIRYNIGYL